MPCRNRRQAGRSGSAAAGPAGAVDNPGYQGADVATQDTVDAHGTDTTAHNVAHNHGTDNAPDDTVDDKGHSGGGKDDKIKHT